MSEGRDKREQAQRLLRSLTDIDDRFLMEAMEGFGQEEGRGGMPETMSGGADETVTAGIKDGAVTAEAAPSPEHAESSEPGEAGGGRVVRFSPRRLRRLSTWALTAAACLTVVIVGRYVAINQGNRAGVEKSATMNLQESELEEAVRKPENAITYDAAEVSSIAEEADQAVPEAGNTAQEAAPSEESLYEADMSSGSVSDSDTQTAAEMSGDMDKAVNPFLDVSSPEKAEEAAGFEMDLPEAEEPYTVLHYRACIGEMLEIIFLNEDDEEGYRIRKAAGAQEDISGDYQEYELEETITLEDGTELSLRGDKKDAWETAVWQRQEKDGDQVYSYAVCAGEKTFTEEEIRKMAESFR